MKLGKWLAVLYGLCFIHTSLGQEIRLMTYNIKYDNTSDTVNNWNYRKADMVRLIKHYRPHVLGTQEVLHHQAQFLDKSLLGYTFVGVGRDDGRQKGEYSAIFYDSVQVKVERSNTFWLSETPQKVSIGWDAALERICTYALFRDRGTKQRFWVFNTHFDHVGELAREKSADLVLQRITAINTENLPVILMGDLNLVPQKRPILKIKEYMGDGLEITQKSFYGPKGTANGFDPNRVLDDRIDYIFVRNAKVLEYIHIDDRMENNKHISDHLPVFSTISLE